MSAQATSNDEQNHGAGQPAVTVLMPAFNAEFTISTAIESVLDQSFSDFELVVVDDGSTDGTARIVEAYARRDGRVRSVRHEQNLGICHALNRGIAEARGALIARMDADDWCYPDRLANQVAYMEANPDVVVSGGAIDICDEQLNPLTERIYHLIDGDIRDHLFMYSPFAHPAIVVRAAALREVGGYSPALVDGEDYDLYFRLGRVGKFGNLRDRVIRLRTSRTSISQSRLIRLELNTMYIRMKAVAEYGYTMGVRDWLYLTAQFLTVFVMPPALRFWLFAAFRSRAAR